MGTAHPIPIPAINNGSNDLPITRRLVIIPSTSSHEEVFGDDLTNIVHEMNHGYS